MIYDLEYTLIEDRSSALEHLAENKYPSVIDVGASYNIWAGSFVTHIVDINPVDTKHHHFKGNICENDVWDEIKRHPKFDFSICTHTLEDILHPLFVVKKLCEISNSGYIAMPSKWGELKRHHSRPWRGWMHHRWLFDVIDGVLVCVPKLSYIEYIDVTVQQDAPDEIQFFWKDNIPVKILNDDFIGPGENEYLNMVLPFLQANS